MYALLFAAFVLCISIALFRNIGRDPLTKKLPPGPPSNFFVGHTFQVPTYKPWLYFEKLAREYGPIVRLSLAGDDVIILTDPKDAEEILSKRSHNYSSRRPLVYAGKYQSKDKRLVLLKYGEELRKQRAAFHSMLQPRVVGSYEHIQERESLRLLHYTLEKPEDTWQNAKRYAASVVYVLTYGKDLDGDGNDKDLQTVLEILDGFTRDCYPGSHLVDTFPVLDCLPNSLATWRNEAKRKHEFEMKLYSRLALEVKAKPWSNCFASRLWEENEKNKFDLVSLSYVAGSAVEAGTDMTSATLLWFIVAIILHPDVLQKAQKEIDAAVGSDGSTIPTFANMKDLPYCFAITREVFRWMPSAAGGFPHYSDEDDEYKGYFIKAKSMVIPNIWSMHRNEEEFPEPTKFIPERHLDNLIYPLKSASLTEGHYGFGFGRRSCPGKFLAVQTIWLAVVRLMWAFEFARAHDEFGREIAVDPKNASSGVTSKPDSFLFDVKPRTKVHEETIRRESALSQRQS